MKEIKLSRGYVTLVDDADFQWLNQWKWCVNVDKTTCYAYRADYSLGKHNPITLMMHRVILNLQDPKQEGEHIDGNGLNNQRSNLRIATRVQNIYNRKIFKNCKSLFKGVSWHHEKWRATIQKDYKPIHIGYFKTKEDAAIAYNSKAIELFGEFANLNKVV